MGSSRLIALPLEFRPDPRHVTVPEPGPGVEELTVTVAETVSAETVLLGCAPQLLGNVISFAGAAGADALRPLPLTESTETVTVDSSLKTFVDPAVPFRLTATSAVLSVETPQFTFPIAMSLLATGATPSPSEIVLSAYAIAASPAAAVTIASTNRIFRYRRRGRRGAVDPISPFPFLVAAMQCPSALLVA
jgi:hypothetical protein